MDLFLYLHLFYFFSCHTVIAQESNTISNKSIKSRCSCLISDLRGDVFRFFPSSFNIISTALVIDMSGTSCIILEYAAPNLPAYSGILSLFGMLYCFTSLLKSWFFLHLFMLCYIYLHAMNNPSHLCSWRNLAYRLLFLYVDIGAVLGLLLTL